MTNVGAEASLSAVISTVQDLSRATLKCWSEEFHLLPTHQVFFSFLCYYYYCCCYLLF